MEVLPKLGREKLISCAQAAAGLHRKNAEALADRSAMLELFYAGRCAFPKLSGVSWRI